MQAMDAAEFLDCVMAQNPSAACPGYFPGLLKVDSLPSECWCAQTPEGRLADLSLVNTSQGDYDVCGRGSFSVVPAHLSRKVSAGSQ